MNSELLATQSIKFTDSHCHLDFSELVTSKDSHNRAEPADLSGLAGLLQQCAKADIARIVVPSVSPDNWQEVLSLPELSQVSGESPVKILPCLGIHPWYLESLETNTLDDLKQLCSGEKSKIAAIGEMGIDGVIAKEQNNMQKQQTFFSDQMAIAEELKKPVIIHHRRSHQEVLAILKSHPQVENGIVHAFSGSFQQAKQYIDLGFKLGIGGTITYPRAEKTRKTVSKLPIESLVLETDAPSMPLHGYQGQANSPLRIIELFETLATLRTEPKEQLAAIIEQNISDIFER